jgi:hypothetical protein
MSAPVLAEQFVMAPKKDVDARQKAGHDGEKRS